MAPWLPSPIETDRIVVRPPRAGDEAAVVALSTDPDVRRFLGGPVPIGVAEARAVQFVSEPTWGRFVIAERAAGGVVGSGDISRKRGPWEISYQLRPASWGVGLASEAISALVDWFFVNTDEVLLIAVTQEANVRSASLLERTGATLSTTFHQYGALQRQYEFRRGGPETRQ